MIANERLGFIAWLLIIQKNQIEKKGLPYSKRGEDRAYVFTAWGAIGDRIEATPEV